MKKCLLVLSMLFCSFVIAVPMVGTALAGDISHFRGEGAEASWGFYDEVSDTYTDIYVWASGELNQQPPGKAQAMRSVMVDVMMYVPSTDSYTEVFCWGEVSTDSFMVNQKLDSASLSVNNLMGYRYEYDYNNDNYTEDPISLDVAIAWTAIGPLTRYNDRSHYQSPDFIYNIRQAGKQREGIAQGTINYDSNTIELGDSSWASILSTQGGYVEVSR